MTEPVVLKEVSPDGVALITLNRPQAMNALSRQLLVELAQALQSSNDDDRVRVIILTGSGKAFCAGLDLKELGSGGADIGKSTVSDGTDPSSVMSKLRKPVIGAINGAAVTGGFEMALACDVLIASTAARFADTHARVGLASSWGLSQKLSRAVGIYRAREISLASRWITAEQAAAWGFVNHVVAPEQLLPAARAMATDMLAAQPGMLERYKSIIDDGFALSFGEGMKLEHDRAKAFNATVSSNDIEGRREAVQQRNRSI